MGKKCEEKKAKVAVVTVARRPGMARMCPCGCQMVVGKKRTFEQGHDARIRGWFVAVAEGEKEATSLPQTLQKAFPIWQKNGAGAFVKVAIREAMVN